MSDSSNNSANSNIPSSWGGEDFPYGTTMPGLAEETAAKAMLDLFAKTGATIAPNMGSASSLLNG